MDRPAGTPKVYTIPAGAPFLPALAEALLTGRFGTVPGFPDDPLALAGVTILLPTRRAARALADLLVARGGGKAVVLPTIRPIGDVDEEDLLLGPASDSELAREQLLLPAAIPSLERLLVLTRLALAWGRASRHAVAEAGQAPLIPTSPADALNLAADLAHLIDEMATGGIDRDALTKIVPDDFARYWQITLEFLQIVTERWPAYLAERRLADPAARRNLFLAARAEQLELAQPPAPIIAAGSTGSIPATARLLGVIARLPAGAVVLPGLDTVLDDAGWTAIGTDAAGAPSHPQFGLKHLLESMGVTRDEVRPLAAVDRGGAARQRLFSQAMRPAETTEAWATATRVDPAALSGLTLAVAAHEQEEALAIALALREAAERPDATAALVTPDRELARRVAVELRRWGMEIDDSAGTPLADTPAGIFARLLATAASETPEPVDLLALVKHPLAAFGFDRAACRRAARTLEIAIFRGMRPEGGLDGLAGAVANARRRARSGGRYLHPTLLRLDDVDWSEAAALAERLATILRPLAANRINAADYGARLVDALTAATTDETGSAALWPAEGGEQLAALLSELGGPGGQELDLGAADIGPFLAAAMRGILVPRRPAADPRIHVWGTLEARLQSVDLMVIAGLDEGVWPAETRTDAWLSRGMRAAIGLPPPERRIGLSAHDFVQAASADTVLLTRAEKRGGSPTVASRWLQRLIAVTGADGERIMAAAGHRFLSWARRLDAVPVAQIKAAERPAPAPPVAERPRRLSITEIETLVRDPYAIYARHVLKLAPLDRVGEAPDYALRGTLVHEALNLFTERRNPLLDGHEEAALYDAAERLFDRLAGFPEYRTLWWLRFREIGRWFLAFERQRDAEIAERHAEISGEWDIATPAGPFVLRGRADRIDLRHDGRIEILDYKTGEPPSPKQVLSGLAPQLALEAAMARAGAFGPEFAGRSVAQLAWLAVGRAGRREPLRSAVENGSTADALAERAIELLGALIARFDQPETAYRSVERPMFERRFIGDYDHLARLGEWSLTVTDDAS